MGAERTAASASPAGGPTVSVAIVRARYNPYGGAERFVQRALGALAARGVDVTVIARRWPALREGGAPPPVRFERVDPFYAGSLWRDWSFARAVRARLALRHDALVQSHERIPGVAVYRAGDGVHAEYLAQRCRALPAWRAALVRASPYHAYVCAAERAMFTHPALRAVICNSEMVRGEIRSRFGVPPERLHLIRNGVDLERFRPPAAAERAAARDALGLPEGAPAFAFVGSGFERKGLAGALRGLARCARPDARLVVAGADKHASRYAALASRLGIAQRVRWLGGVDDVRPALWAADALVLPTLYDPFPNAALEALACGRAVLTSTKSGAAELIEPGANGEVADALDVPGIAAALERLAGAADDAARVECARASVATLSLDALAGELIALYRALIESAAP